MDARYTTQRGGLTPLLTDARYTEVIVAATITGAIFGRHVRRIRRVVAVIDALGLGAYAAFGTQKALLTGVAVPAAILVGVINAAGGGLLRDIITREEPLVFRPGQFYVLTAVAGAVTFVFLAIAVELDATPVCRHRHRRDVSLPHADNCLQLADVSARPAAGSGSHAVKPRHDEIRLAVFLLPPSTRYL